VRSAADRRRRTGPGDGSGAGDDCRDRERGAAVVDFALVAGLLALVVAGVVQLTLAVHVRNTLVDCAAEGARYAALADRTTDDGVARTRALIAASLADGYGDQVTAVETDLRGLPVVEVRVTAPLPVVGLLGPGGMLTVSGHALREGP
jgi:Flp pilus assembly protein TadG